MSSGHRNRRHTKSANMGTSEAPYSQQQYISNPRNFQQYYADAGFQPFQQSQLSNESGYPQHETVSYVGPQIDPTQVSDVGEEVMNNIIGREANATKKRKPRPKKRLSNNPNAKIDSGSSRPVTPTTNRPTSFERISSNTPPPKTAYAGPTFHASPAPSSLPIPRFFSKSVPSSLDKNGLNARLIAESAKDEEPTEQLPDLKGGNNVPARNESPLDILFKADREEKARARSRGVATPSADSPLSTTAQFGSFQSTPQGGQRPHDSRLSAESPGYDMFALELGNSESPRQVVGPAFTTPYQDRLRALRQTPTPPVGGSQQERDEEDRKAKSRALKTLLFSGNADRSASSSSPQSGELSLAVEQIPDSPSPSETPAFTETADPQQSPLASKTHRSRNAPPPRGALRPPSYGRSSPRSVSGLRREVAPAKAQDGFDISRGPVSPIPLREHQLKSASTPGLGLHDGKGPPPIYPANPGTLQSPSVRSNQIGQEGPQMRQDGSNIKAMEDGLRDILRLGPGSSGGYF
ncbi:MAG: hypothetical protein M1824_006544 [Vezdaea acicularis]|nr:MAG: hypothetical protein M1824_006544 [Vezdaea acicularis]